MHREPGDVLEALQAAVHAGSEVGLFAIFIELTTGLCMCARFPDEAFERLESLLGDPVFWGHWDAWELVKEIDASWALLTAQQKARIRPLLVSSFDKWANPMGAFVIAELLGERYGGEDALKTLSGLARVAAMPARTLVPHGLEVLARTTEDAALKQRSISRLRELEKDEEEEIRREACIALKRISGE